MKSLAVFILLSSMNLAQADSVVMQGEIDLAKCQTINGLVETGLSGKVQINMTLELESGLVGKSTVKKMDYFRMDEESDRPIDEYACLFSTSYERRDVSTHVSMNGDTLEFNTLGMNLESIDSVQASSESASCNANDIATEVNSSITIVQTAGGQTLVKPIINNQRYDLLLNIAPTIQGTKIASAKSSSFIVNKAQSSQAISWTLGRENMQNNDDLMFIECQSSLQTSVK